MQNFMQNFMLDSLARHKTFSHQSPTRKVLSTLFAVCFALGGLAVTGCDLGTYRQRLDETVVTPAEKAPEDEAADASVDEATDGDSEDRDESQ